MNDNKTSISKIRFMDRIERLEADRKELKSEVLQLIVISKAQRKTMAHQDTEIKRMAKGIQDNLEKYTDFLDFCGLKP